MEDLKIVIEGRLPSLNEYIDKCRMNRMAGAQMKKSTERIIIANLMTQADGIKFEKPVHIHFNWYEKNRRRDKDNVAFAKKFILDALQSYGMLSNDNWLGVDSFEDHFFVDKTRPRVEVLIWENY